ncbi:MAG: ATP-binding protein [Nitrospirales bacterium]|nr:ATP-binding protein [Nitrospirales bacterium]
MIPSDLAVTHVGIIGAGKGGTAMLEALVNLPHVKLVGIADCNPRALGLQVANFHHIPTTLRPLDLIQNPHVQLLINVTGDPSMASTISHIKAPGTEALGGAGAKVLWDFIQHGTMIQAQLFQAEKLAGFGTFASGIAHDINNPLYVILAMAENIQEETDLSLIHEHAVSIHEAAQRIHAISRNITQYARSASTQETLTVDLHAKLDEALTIARFATKFHEITIQKHYNGSLEIAAKPEEIVQIFVNLMTNAIHAMEGKGSLILATDKANGQVHVSISDSGCGIPPENLQKIFDPFFTTKINGMGTGLGLYNVRTILRKYHGDLRIESEVGKGTTFYLSFPASPSSEMVAHDHNRTPST